MNKKQPQYIIIFNLIAILLLSFSSCFDPQAYYFVEDSHSNQEINRLITLIPEESEEIRFVLVEQVVSLLEKYGDGGKAILFLTDYVEKYPLDPYNTYYLYKVASTYEEQKAFPMAVHYYERILNLYPDIKIKENNIHYLCIKKLLKYVSDKEKHVEYYKLLLSRYIDRSIENVGRIYYSLARSYEELGEWDRAIQEFLKFLKYPATQIPGEPEAYEATRAKVQFYYSNKSWTRSSLDGLVNEVRYALLTKNVVRLKRLETQNGFFNKFWHQEDYSQQRAAFFNLGNFLLNSDIRVNTTLDPDSTSKEAYLKTTRWAYRVPTWYFYFRRIDFPADPEYDGRWEWAGIYFGDK